MTKKEAERLGRRLLPELRGFAAKGEMIFMQPVGHTLRGVCFDRGGFDRDRFYAHVFAQPLFMPPVGHIILTVGFRIGGNSQSWNASEPEVVPTLVCAIKREAVGFLSRIREPLDLVEVAGAIGLSDNPFVIRAAAYAFALSGDVERACGAAKKFAAFAASNRYWLQEAEALEALQENLLVDARGVQLQLLGWEDETRERLGVGRVG
jgi:hypothetical protein